MGGLRACLPACVPGRVLSAAWTNTLSPPSAAFMAASKRPFRSHQHHMTSPLSALTVDDVDHDGGRPRVGRRAGVVARVEAADVVDGERGHDRRGGSGGRGGRVRGGCGHPHLDLQRQVGGLEIRCSDGFTFRVVIM